MASAAEESSQVNNCCLPGKSQYHDPETLATQLVKGSSTAEARAIFAIQNQFHAVGRN